MDSDDIGTALKEAAEHWTIPDFDAKSLIAQSEARRSRARRRLLGCGVATVAIAGTLATLLLTHSDQRTQVAAHPSSPTISTGTPPGTGPAVGLAPAQVPLVEVSPINSIGTLHGQPVLARRPAGHAVTVSARLSFPATSHARVTSAALLVAVPGTMAGVSGDSDDSYYTTTRIAEGSTISATPPQTRLMTVSTPANLPPGTYPVFQVMHTALTPGQEPGVAGPLNESSQIGVIVLTGS